MAETAHISNKQVNNVLGPLRQAFQEAFYDGHIDAKPMDRFRYRLPETREPQPFNQDEISRILAQLQGQEKTKSYIVPVNCVCLMTQLLGHSGKATISSEKEYGFHHYIRLVLNIVTLIKLGILSLQCYSLRAKIHCG